MWAVQRGYKEENWGIQLLGGWQFSWALQGRLRRDGAVIELTVHNSSVRAAVAKRTWAPETEESQVVEAVARERLVKTYKAGKGLAGAVMICKVRRLAIAL
jgi:hypothetical protein